MELTSINSRSLSQSLLDGVDDEELLSIDRAEDRPFQLLRFLLRLALLDEKQPHSLPVVVRAVLKTILLIIHALGVPYYVYLNILNTTQALGNTPYSVRCMFALSCI